MVVNNGTIASIRNAAWREYDSRYVNDIVINGGNINGNIQNQGKLKITGGNFTKSITHASPLELEISNATFNNTQDNSSSDLTVINSTGYATSVTIKDSEFVATFNTVSSYSSYGKFYGIYCGSTTDLTINNSSFEFNGYDVFTGTRDSVKREFIYGIYNISDGSININNTDIITTSDNSDSLYTVAIYNAGKGDLNLGTKDDSYNSEDFTIYGTHNAIYNAQGKMNLYDGILKSDENASPSPISDIEDGYEVNRGIVNEYDVITLSNTISNKVLNVDTNEYYHSLHDAINAVENDANLQVITDYLYETYPLAYIIS